MLVVGGGVAGLSLALRLADQRRVTLLAKGALTESASRYAQGGVAAVLTDGDSVDKHVQDTLAAGAGLCDAQAVQFTVERSRACIQWLIDMGVEFTLRDGDGDGDRGYEGDGLARYHLTREGGHRERRIIHAADETGRAIVMALEQRVRAHPNISLLDHHLGVELIREAAVGPSDRPDRVLGLYALDRRSGRVRTFSAPVVALATGGTGKVYLYTSNPDVATGDGIAMAWRAGCRVANMEFIQFHPTCLFHPEAKSFLISEALRGEGAVLKLPDGRRFMDDYHADAELAPRDVVARAIDAEMKRRGLDCVYLDITAQPKERVLRLFPAIAEHCRSFGLDITSAPIPVVPAAHYLCGGVVTDRHARTDLSGLYVVGEAAYTGLHGANRLASNSLLECLVFAQSAAEDILARPTPAQTPAALPPWDESRVSDSDEQVVVSHNWDELRRFMWDYVGIVRTDKRLWRARHRIDLLRGEIDEYYGNFRISNDLIELRNLALVADLTSALRSRARRASACISAATTLSAWTPPPAGRPS